MAEKGPSHRPGWAWYRLDVKSLENPINKSDLSVNIISCLHGSSFAERAYPHTRRQPAQLDRRPLGDGFLGSLAHCCYGARVSYIWIRPIIRPVGCFLIMFVVIGVSCFRLEVGGRLTCVRWIWFQLRHPDDGCLRPWHRSRRWMNHSHDRTLGFLSMVRFPTALYVTGLLYLSLIV